MARKKGKKRARDSYIPDLTGEAWVAEWSQRVGYVPPPAAPRGQGLRKVTVENMGPVIADPTLFTRLGPSKRTQHRRASRRPSRAY